MGGGGGGGNGYRIVAKNEIESYAGNHSVFSGGIHGEESKPQQNERKSKNDKNGIRRLNNPKSAIFKWICFCYSKSRH